VNETLFQSATDAADMLRRRKTSSRELTELLLARIDAVNPAVNAVVELRREAALQEAAAADKEIARGVPGPLLGVPMTIKESFNVGGLHTTWGNPAFKDHVADSDATVVRRLKQAGAILVGKTNLPFMLGDFGQTANELYGVTNNPWDTTRTPGGSSGGGAAALSAGMTFLEYGSDLVGSIRIPASFCGVYGLRPSVEIVPLTGFQPPGPPPGPSDRRPHRRRTDHWSTLRGRHGTDLRRTARGRHRWIRVRADLMARISRAAASRSEPSISPTGRPPPARHASGLPTVRERRVPTVQHQHVSFGIAE
jgi:amidase